MWDTTNKRLAVVAAILLIIALLITIVPEVQAQYGGRCYATYIRYYDRRCRCYITQKIWRCSGYVRPRRPQRYYRGY
jgi:hypothetical protein